MSVDSRIARSPCAQRLAASLESAPSVTSHRGRASRVLNAWRRHWNRHNSRVAMLERHRAVLNAWRRHWNRHASCIDRRSHRVRCAQRLAASLESARRSRGDRLDRGVLNAWRRHWNRHLLDRRSSPVALDVLNAWRRHWNRHTPALVDGNVVDSGAQRLAASLESAPNVRPSSTSTGDVLNAWRRHWNRHRMPSNPCNRQWLRLQESRTTTNRSTVQFVGVVSNRIAKEQFYKSWSYRGLSPLARASCNQKMKV